MADEPPDYQIAPDKCPHCGHLVDGMTAVEKGASAPKPGDIGMCIACGEFMVVSVTKRFRAMTQAEWDDASP